MKKKFKNTFAVNGKQSLLRAFAEELKEIGWTYKSSMNSSCNPDSFSENINCLIVDSRHGKYYGQSYTHTEYNNTEVLSLPQDWDRAIALAKEEFVVVPEYVKCTKGSAKKKGDIGFIPSKIYKVESIQDDFPKSLSVKGEHGKILHVFNWTFGEITRFEPSTKEAYEAQQNTPKYKVGDFLKGTEDYFARVAYVTGYDSIKDKYIASFDDHKVDAPYEKEFFEERYVPITDEEALEILKEKYAKQGIVEGAKFKCLASEIHTITGFKLVKNIKYETKNFPCLDYGSSQLAILFGNDVGYYVTPTTEGFTVLPKEVKVAGYPTSKRKITVPIVKIGCQWYTKDSLITIRDLIIHGIQDEGRTSARFQLSGVGNVYVTVDELNQAINLFDDKN